MARCGNPPLPEDDKLTCFCFDSATSSGKVLTSTDGCTAMTSGVSATVLIGSKSLAVSYGKLS